MPIPTAWVDVGGRPFGDIVSAAGITLLLTNSNEIEHLTAWDRTLGKKLWAYQAPKPWSTFRPAVDGNTVRVGYPGRIIELDLRTGTEKRTFDIDGSPRGLAWHGTTSYVGLLQGRLLRLQTPE